jgi:hypothetical protein
MAVDDSISYFLVPMHPRTLYPSKHHMICLPDPITCPYRNFRHLLRDFKMPYRRMLLNGPPFSISLTSADVAQHRRPGKTTGRRTNP